MACKSLMVELGKSGLKPCQVRKAVNAMKSPNQPNVTSKQCADILAEERKQYKAVDTRRGAEEDEEFKTINSMPNLSSIHPIEAKVGNRKASNASIGIEETSCENGVSALALCVGTSQVDMMPQISVRDPVVLTKIKGRPREATRVKHPLEVKQKKTSAASELFLVGSRTGDPFCSPVFSVDGGSKQEKETDDLQTTIRKCSGVEEKETDPQKTIRRCSGVDSTDTITIARRPSCAHLCPVQVMAQPPLISAIPCENLDTLSLKHDDTMDDLLTISKRKSEHLLMKAELFRKKNFRISSNPVIACVNLRVHRVGLIVHKVKRSFINYLSTRVESSSKKYMYYPMPSIRNLRELNIDGVRMDDAFLNVINSGFTLLESLTLDISSCVVEIMDIRCVTLKRLKIRLMALYNQQVQVNGPKLFVFHYKCFIWPTFLFPTIVPEKIELRLKLIHPIDHMFILKMRETLELSSKFSIEIKSNLSTFIMPFDIDDARTPVTNVEKLLFERISLENSQDKSLLIDTLFSICRPNKVEVSYILAHNVANYLSVVEKKTGNVYWPNVEIRDPEDDGKWETLSTSSISLLDEWFHCEFKPNWQYFP
ncbi:hypothetical protein Tco_1530856 [Tanacetum coccineum]